MRWWQSTNGATAAFVTGEESREDDIVVDEAVAVVEAAVDAVAMLDVVGKSSTRCATGLADLDGRPGSEETGEPPSSQVPQTEPSTIPTEGAVDWVPEEVEGGCLLLEKWEKK